MTAVPTYLNIAIPSPLEQLFDYLPNTNDDINNYQIGKRVLVNFNHQEKIGIIIDKNTTSKVPKDKLKTVIKILDETPLIDKRQLKLMHWLSSYYHHPLNDIAKVVLPNLLTKAELVLNKKTRAKAVVQEKHSSTIILNAEQNKAVDIITKSNNEFNVFLLNGVTGSGKTEVYLHAIDKIIKDQGQALVLVPEINLTPQTVTRFVNFFGADVTSYHSGLTDNNRLDIYFKVKTGNLKIVIGTRSALFLPFKNLKTIIVDEEHDSSYKQNDSLRYHARDVAVMRAKFTNIPIVLGSATPSTESMQNTISKKYHEIILSQRAATQNKTNIEIIDVNHKKLFHGLSYKTLELITDNLQAGGQVLLFINRRGFAPVLLCGKCGFIAVCENCDAKLTIHKNPDKLICHHCDRKYPIFNNCPSCDNEMSACGVGTQRLESAIENKFKDYPVLRIDSDSINTVNKLKANLEIVNTNKPCILIGTQILAKGHDFKNLNLVVIVNADSSFFSSDYRQTEKIGQLIEQVAGRAGRHEKLGKVIIQSMLPHNPSLNMLIKDGYYKFACELLEERKKLQLPPIAPWSIIRADAKHLDDAINFLNRIKQFFKNYNIKLFGPNPAPLKRRKGKFRAQLLLRGNSRKDLHIALQAFSEYKGKIKTKSGLSFHIEIDPIDFF